MRVMRAEPSRFTDATARSVGAVWRSYDLQLTTYAALLGVFGLVMAYTNSVEAGQSVMDSGTVFSRGADVVRPRHRRLHRRDRLRLPLAQDAGVADLRHQPRAARRDTRHR